MKSKIFGIDNIEEIDSLKEPLKIRIYFKYPDYDDLLNLIPKERIREIRRRQRENLKSFISTIKNDFIKIGRKINPSGLELDCNKSELLKFNKDRRIDNISIINLEKDYDSDIEPFELYYTFIVRFAIQIENKTKGLQNYEDRVLIMKAFSEDEAKKKLKKGFKTYEKPYLNSFGELVRWKFEEFLDSYATCYSSLEDMLSSENEGIEIFSRIKSRRLNNNRTWIIKSEK